MLLSAAVAVQASDYDYLTFLKADGTSQSMTANGLVITFEDGHLVAKNGSEQTTFILADMSRMYFTAEASATVVGDVNGDGSINVGDIMAIINQMADPTARPVSGGISAGSSADVNGDGSINVGDIMAVINIMASASQQ